MFKSLLRTLPSLTGNAKLSLKLNNIVKDEMNSSLFHAYIKNATIDPLQNNLFNHDIKVNLLEGSWEFDISRFYNNYFDKFYKDNFNIIKDDYLFYDDTNVNQDSRNKNYEFGCRRNSYFANGYQFSFFAPIYINDINDLPDYFDLHIQIRNNNEKIIRVHFDEENSYIKLYLEKYLSKIDKKVIYIINENKRATYFGIDVEHGGLVDIIDNGINYIFNYQTTLNNFDKIVNQGFERNKLIIRQILPISFDFNIEEVLSNIEIKRYAFLSIDNIYGNYVKNQINQELYDFDIDYQELNINNKNVFDNPSILSLKENLLNIYKYENKLSPSYGRWKLALSKNENLYYFNINLNFNDKYNKYSKFPILKNVTNIDIDTYLSKSKNGNYIDINEITNNKNYINNEQEYITNWFNIIPSFNIETIFNQKYWNECINNYAYVNGVLYDFNNLVITKKISKIDYFSIFYIPTFNIYNINDNKNYLYSSNYIIQRSKNTEYYNFNFNNIILNFEEENKLNLFSKSSYNSYIYKNINIINSTFNKNKQQFINIDNYVDDRFIDISSFINCWFNLINSFDTIKNNVKYRNHQKLYYILFEDNNDINSDDIDKFFENIIYKSPEIIQKYFINICNLLFDVFQLFYYENIVNQNLYSEIFKDQKNIYNNFNVNGYSYKLKNIILYDQYTSIDNIFYLENIISSSQLTFIDNNGTSIGEKAKNIYYKFNYSNDIKNLYNFPITLSTINPYTEIQFYIKKNLVNVSDLRKLINELYHSLNKYYTGKITKNIENYGYKIDIIKDNIDLIILEKIFNLIIDEVFNKTLNSIQNNKYIKNTNLHFSLQHYYDLFDLNFYQFNKLNNDVYYYSKYIKNNKSIYVNIINLYNSYLNYVYELLESNNDKTIKTREDIIDEYKEWFKNGLNENQIIYKYGVIYNNEQFEWFKELLYNNSTIFNEIKEEISYNNIGMKLYFALPFYYDNYNQYQNISNKSNIDDNIFNINIDYIIKNVLLNDGGQTNYTKITNKQLTKNSKSLDNKNYLTSFGLKTYVSVKFDNIDTYENIVDIWNFEYYENSCFKFYVYQCEESHDNISSSLSYTITLNSENIINFIKLYNINTEIFDKSITYEINQINNILSYYNDNHKEILNNLTRKIVEKIFDNEIKKESFNNEFFESNINAFDIYYGFLLLGGYFSELTYCDELIKNDFDKFISTNSKSLNSLNGNFINDLIQQFNKSYYLYIDVDNFINKFNLQFTTIIDQKIKDNKDNEYEISYLYYINNINDEIKNNDLGEKYSQDEVFDIYDKYVAKYNVNFNDLLSYIDYDLNLPNLEIYDEKINIKIKNYQSINLNSTKFESKILNKGSVYFTENNMYEYYLSENTSIYYIDNKIYNVNNLNKLNNIYIGDIDIIKNESIILPIFNSPYYNRNENKYQKTLFNRNITYNGLNYIYNKNDLFIGNYLCEISYSEIVDLCINNILNSSIKNSANIDIYFKQLYNILQNNKNYILENPKYIIYPKEYILGYYNDINKNNVTHVNFETQYLDKIFNYFSDDENNVVNTYSNLFNFIYNPLKLSNNLIKKILINIFNEIKEYLENDNIENYNTTLINKIINNVIMQLFNIISEKIDKDYHNINDHNTDYIDEEQYIIENSSSIYNCYNFLNKYNEDNDVIASLKYFTDKSNDSSIIISYILKDDLIRESILSILNSWFSIIFNLSELDEYHKKYFNELYNNCPYIFDNELFNDDIFESLDTIANILLSNNSNTEIYNTIYEYISNYESFYTFLNGNGIKKYTALTKPLLSNKLIKINDNIDNINNIIYEYNISFIDIFYTYIYMSMFLYYLREYQNIYKSNEFIIKLFNIKYIENNNIKNNEFSNYNYYQEYEQKYLENIFKYVNLDVDLFTLKTNSNENLNIWINSAILVLKKCLRILFVYLYNNRYDIFIRNIKKSLNNQLYELSDYDEITFKTLEDFGYINLYKQKLIDNQLNIFESNGKVYGCYILNSTITNTVNTFNLLNNYSFEYIYDNNQLVKLTNTSFYNYIPKLLKVIKYNLFYLFTKSFNDNIIVYPDKFILSTQYGISKNESITNNYILNNNLSNIIIDSYNINSNKYIYNIIKNPSQKITLHRYTNFIEPILVHKNNLYIYNLKYKSNNISYGDDNIYKSYININTYNGIPLFKSKNTKYLLNEYDIVYEHEYQSFNNNKYFLLLPKFEISFNKFFEYEELLNYETNDIVIKYFSNYIQKFHNSIKLKENEILFLFNKYKVTFISNPIKLNINKTNKLYSLKYIFTLL